VISKFEQAMKEALQLHWPEYLIEAWCLGAFMVSACFFGVALLHPASPAVSAVGPATRNLLMGLAMGTTAVMIIRSPWGRRSGAHFNPAVTLTFMRLGKVDRHDGLFYIAAHFAGGLVGVVSSWLVLGDLLADSAVNFVVTIPGKYGLAAAFAAEVVIAFVLMLTVLFTTNAARLSRFTPFFAGSLVAIYITFEAPLSGMSMNPARTFASAAVAGSWTGWWVYFTAPPLAMLAAAEVFVRTRGLSSVLCAKLDHAGTARCIFNCEVGKRDDITRAAILARRVNA
jgi:aquaporin Z